MGNAADDGAFLALVWVFGRGSDSRRSLAASGTSGTSRARRWTRYDRTVGGHAPLSRSVRHDRRGVAIQAASWLHRRPCASRKMYRRTVLGWLWLFINPLFPIALRAVIFGGLLGVGSDGLPYFLFLLAGTVVWDVFAASLMWGTRSLEMHGDLSDQIYHPRAILPFGNMTPALLNVALKMGVLVLAVAFYHAS